MALTPDSYLKPDPNVIFRDQQHAARLFVDDNFRLAPKHKFLFHVAFSINQAALKSIELVQRHRNEINMLVKSVDLPSFEISTETLNQYNRKKNIQYTHKLQPASIKFHDDNMGLINQLWQNYYSYYYADSTSAKDPAAYNRNATRSSDFIPTPYGLDNRSTIPFFNYITIYQMARHEYVSYTLHNPIITSWNHNGLDYASTNLHDNTMKLAYEAVSYGSGEVTAGDPEGFALEHYDQTPSPLQSSGTLPSASPTFTTNKTITDNAADFINTATAQINTYANTQVLQNAGTPGLLSTLITTSTQGVSGLQGIAFPLSQNTETAAVATVRNFTK